MQKRKTVVFVLAILIFLGYSLECPAGVVRDMPNLSSITFWEATSGLNAFTFTTDSDQLTTRRSDPLSNSNYDFVGVPNLEFYDVFYSDANGFYNIDGEFVTVEALFNVELPAGGGLNLAEVEFNFTDGSSQYAISIGSYLALGNNAEEESVINAVDGDTGTYTTMGNTIGQSQRLRVTVSPVPVPGAIWLLGAGLAGLAGIRIRRKKK